MRWLLPLLLFAAASIQAEDFSFDLASYQKKPYEWNGYLELNGEQAWLDRDAALYHLNAENFGAPDSVQRYSMLAQLEGLYRFGRSAMHARARFEVRDDDLSGSRQFTWQELYYAANPNEQLRLELGKRALKWGKGYAWNPVGFVERRKDPNDPDLSREGYFVATADWVRTFDGPLRTLAFSPVVLPVREGLNEDFSAEEDLNFAARLYLLYQDTDIDLYALGQGSHSARVGLDFSRNLGSNFEIHGEFAYLDDAPKATLQPDNTLARNTRDAALLLLGIRYLTASDLTWIAEYYHNGAGYEQDQLAQFFRLARTDPAIDPAAFSAAEAARSAGYGMPNLGKDYLYLRGSQKEPFDMVYVTASLTGMFNLHDGSYSLTPELLYTGLPNTELRARASLLNGGRDSEFGEKQNDGRLEVRLRYFF